MSIESSTNSERINIRLKESSKSLIERAASFEGKSISNFILSSALAKAEKAILKHESMKLNAQDSQRFFDALSKPIQFNTKLTKALAEHDSRVTTSK